MKLIKLHFFLLIGCLININIHAVILNIPKSWLDATSRKPKSSMPTLKTKVSQDSQSQTTSEHALHLAVAQHDNTKVKALLKTNPSVVNQQNAIGETALHIATRHGYHDLVSLLLFHQADPNIQDNTKMWKQTPLHIAVMNSDILTTIVLINHQNIDLSIKDAGGETALEYARREALDYARRETLSEIKNLLKRKLFLTSKNL